jgi:hypothetical protein
MTPQVTLIAVATSMVTLALSFWLMTLTPFVSDVTLTLPFTDVVTVIVID